MISPWRICSFPGSRAAEIPPARTKCELSARPIFCKKATGYAVYVWGSAALCEKHMVEECGDRTLETA